MSEQKTKSPGQIAYEALIAAITDPSPECFRLMEWVELGESHKAAFESAAQVVAQAVIEEQMLNDVPRTPQSSFTPELAEKIETEMHRDASLNLPPQAAQVARERRCMTPEERKAAGGLVIRQLSTPQRYPVLSAEQAKAQEAMRPMTPEEHKATDDFLEDKIK